MVQAFVAALLALVTAISSSVAGSVPGSKDANPSQTAKSVSQAVPAFVKENNPSTFEPSSNETTEQPLGTPYHDPGDNLVNLPPVEGNPTFSLSGLVVQEPPEGLLIDSNLLDRTTNAAADFGQGVASQTPEAPKTDGKAFGESVSGTVQH